MVQHMESYRLLYRQIDQDRKKVSSGIWDACSTWARESADSDMLRAGSMVKGFHETEGVISRPL